MMFGDYHDFHVPKYSELGEFMVESEVDLEPDERGISPTANGNSNGIFSFHDECYISGYFKLYYHLRTVLFAKLFHTNSWSLLACYMPFLLC